MSLIAIVLAEFALGIGVSSRKVTGAMEVAVGVYVHSRMIDRGIEFIPGTPFLRLDGLDIFDLIGGKQANGDLAESRFQQPSQIALFSRSASRVKRGMIESVHRG